MGANEPARYLDEHVDALAAIAIALYDLAGRALDVPISTLLGRTASRGHPGLCFEPAQGNAQGAPRSCRRMGRQGFKGIKFTAVVSDQGIEAEIAALREAVGPDIDIMVDMNWKFEAAEAVRIIKRLEPHNLYFAEAPVQPENLEGQARVARSIGVPLALGEELRTAYDYRPHFEARAMSIVQPEMGHSGITEFVRIGHMAQIFHMNVIPHASITPASSWRPASRPPRPSIRSLITNTSTRYSTGTRNSPSPAWPARTASMSCPPGRGYCI